MGSCEGEVEKEIVTHGTPIERVGEYVSRRDWNALVSEQDAVVIDIRNDYETRIGKFKGAVDPCTTAFRDFPSWVENRFGLADPEDQLETACLDGSAEAGKGKKILPRVAMYCTGGIGARKLQVFP